jgi:hypothetical protein
MPGSYRSANMSAPAHAIQPEPQDAPAPSQGLQSRPAADDAQPSHQRRKQVHGTRIFLARSGSCGRPATTMAPPSVSASTVSMLAEHGRLSLSDRAWQ